MKTKRKVIVPVGVDMTQYGARKLLKEIQIRVWCHPKKGGDDYYYVFPSIKKAELFIKKNDEAEDVPLFALNGYEFNLLETKVGKC